MRHAVPLARTLLRWVAAVIVMSSALGLGAGAAWAGPHPVSPPPRPVASKQHHALPDDGSNHCDSRTIDGVLVSDLKTTAGLDCGYAYYTVYVIMDSGGCRPAFVMGSVCEVKSWAPFAYLPWRCRNTTAYPSRIAHVECEYVGDGEDEGFSFTAVNWVPWNETSSTPRSCSLLTAAQPHSGMTPQCVKRPVTVSPGRRE